MEFESGRVRVTVAPDEAVMGELAARKAADSLIREAASGKKVALWLMAAPSGFTFYEAFTSLVAAEPILAAILRTARYFQFDDYPVGRDDSRFPITFRHLLETRFFGPLERITGFLPGKRLLELRGDAGDGEVIDAYRRALLEVLEDESWFVVEVKGIGMDGHWGFHGKETPLDEPPGFVRVRMNQQNIQQQLLDWPEYFRSASDVPATAVTADAALFMMADLIIDLVPQESKAFAVLACYGPRRVSPRVPSSLLKNHPDAHSFLTELSAGALLEYRRDGTPERPVSDRTLERLKAAWRNPANPERELENVEEMLETLNEVFRADALPRIG